jgi:hypothetical protein
MGMFLSKKQLNYAQLALLTSDNTYYFFYAIKELNPVFHQEMEREFPREIEIMNAINELHESKIFPYLADIEMDEPFLKDIKHLHNEIVNRQIV